jgi:hypothetical protein
VVGFSLREVGWKHIISFSKLVKSNKRMKVKHLICFVTTWCIWRVRNKILFRGGGVDFSGLVDNIKFIYYFWFIGRSSRYMPMLVLFFPKWCNNFLY